MGRYDAEIEQEKRKIAEQQQLICRYYHEYEKRIEQHMREENYDRIVALFEQKDVLELAQSDHVFAVLNIIVNIYRMELNEQAAGCIWYGRHSIDDIVTVYLQLKMYLWRLEFTDDRTSFMRYVAEQKLSVSCVKWLIHTSAFKKAETIYQIAILYKEHGSFVQAFHMLHYLNECGCNPELVYCEMADIYMRLQQYDAAVEYVKKIQHPSQLLERYKRNWGLVDM